MSIRPKKATTRNYAKGGSVYVDPERYSGWPQMAGSWSPMKGGDNGMGDEGGSEGGLPPSGKGTARVSFKKYPGWPQMG